MRNKSRVKLKEWWGGYIRSATAPGNLKKQRRIIEQMAKKMGVNLKIYDEGGGISGLSPSKFKKRKKIFKDIRGGRVKGLFVSDPSRFSRDPIDFVRALKTFKKYRICVCTP